MCDMFLSGALLFTLLAVIGYFTSLFQRRFKKRQVRERPPSLNVYDINTAHDKLFISQIRYIEKLIIDGLEDGDSKSMG